MVKEWFALSENTRRNIFNEVGAREGLPSGAIEKDWWVSLALRIVFSLPFAEYLVFKGGTSLSKGWNLIDRFSEDIDLAIDRKYLGFDGELSKTQVKKLKKVSSRFVREDFAKGVSDWIEAMGVPDVNVHVQDGLDSDTDPLTIELFYKSLTDDSRYLRPRVLLEVGARSLMEPSEKRLIQSMIDVHFKGRDFGEAAVPVPIVLPKRTFLEKAFLLHEEFQKPHEQIRVDRLSRHLYDLERLMHTQHGEDALADPALFKSIIAHREKFNSMKGVDYATHKPASIDFVPPAAVIKKWKVDYGVMQENMIWGESKSFEALIKSLEQLRERFRKIKLE